MDDEVATAGHSGGVTEQDLRLFREGRHYRLYDKWGARFGVDAQGAPGVYFTVWAPDAERVSLIGDFTGWKEDDNLLRVAGNSGVWQGFVPGLRANSR